MSVTLKGKMNTAWREDYLVNCIDKYCYNDLWGFFYINSIKVTLNHTTSELLYKKVNGAWEEFDNSITFTMDGGLTHDDVRTFLATEVYVAKKKLVTLKNYTLEYDLYCGSTVINNCDNTNLFPYPTKKLSGGRSLNVYSFTVTTMDVEQVTDFLDQKIIVCDDGEWSWKENHRPIYMYHKAGDEIFIGEHGKSTILQVYDSTDDNVLQVRYSDGEIADIDTDRNIIELPDYIEDKELEHINHSYNERLLLPHVVYYEGCYNVYWYLVPGAVAYHVEVYVRLNRPNTPPDVKLKDFVVSRNTGYLVIKDLIKGGFVFKVFAEDDEGNIIAESRGIIDRDGPITIRR